MFMGKNRIVDRYLIDSYLGSRFRVVRVVRCTKPEHVVELGVTGY